MELKKIWQNTRGFAIKVAKSLNKKIAVTVGAVIVLGGAVLLNFLLVPAPAEKKEGLDVAIDLTDVSAAVAEKEAESASKNGDKKTDVFSEMTLSRKQARDEAMEVLTEVCESATSIDSMKEEALAGIKSIAADIEREANIESLVMAKGFEECVAVVNGDTASIIVKTDGLLDSEVAQISEIAYEQAGIHPEKLNIIESE